MPTETSGVCTACGQLIKLDPDAPGKKVLRLFSYRRQKEVSPEDALPMNLEEESGCEASSIKLQYSLFIHEIYR